MKKTTHEFDSICSVLDALVHIEQRKLQLWDKEIASLPRGSLYCFIRPDGVYYYHCVDGRKKGITKDLNMLYALARKKYLKTRVSEHQQDLNRISRIIKTGKIDRGNLSEVEKLLHYYGKLGLDILRITCSKEQYQWAKGSYYKNTRDPENLVFETFSGIKVRSKSERDIGNALELNGIPYRYEMGIEMDTSWMEGVSGGTMGMYKTYFPDFTILTSTGDYIIWEHLGRVDLPDYRFHNMEKISAYRQSGQFPEHMVILTFEKDLRSQSSLSRIILTRVLPYIG